MFNLIKDLGGLVEDVITFPTDFIGLTNFSSKKEARQAVDLLLASGEINNKQHQALMTAIDNEKTLNF